MASSSTRPSLLSRVRDPADSQAWREFDALYRHLLRRYARRRGLQASDAEDVAQAALVALARALRRFRYRPEVGRFRDYLGRIARNETYRFLRARNPAAGVLETAQLEELAARDRTDEVWEREWADHHVRRALARLRSSCEERTLAIFERVLSGESPRSVADSLSMSLEAVYKANVRIRKRVEELIAEQVRAEELLELERRPRPR